MKIYLCPSELRFTQNSISRRFKNGSTLEDTLKALLDSGCPDSLPPMHVMQYQGKYFVLEGNRRLLLLKILQKHGLVGNVPVKLSAFNRCKFMLKFSTKNDGESIKVRGNPNMEEELELIVEEGKRKKLNYHLIIVLLRHQCLYI